MNISKRFIPVTLLALGVVGVIATVNPTSAQPAAAPAPARVAIANPARIFNEMQETKDLKVKIENERKLLEDTERGKRAKLQQLQDELRLLNTTSPQYADKSRELTQAAIEFRSWGEITQQELQRTQRNQMKALFDKIQVATATVASAKGYDLVLADQRPDIPDNLEQLTVDQLRVLINQRNVLFANVSVDISADVIVQLDSDFKNRK